MSPVDRPVLLALASSVAMLSVGAYLVLGLWYPQPLWRATGVFRVSAIALLLHLVLTALLWIPWRNRRSVATQSTKNDAAVLGFLLLLVWIFSLSFIAQGRPVALVFAVDRVVLLRANEVRIEELASQETRYRSMRWTGPPPLLAAVPSSDERRMESIELAVAGFDIQQRPSHWVPLENRRDPLKEASGRFAAQSGDRDCLQPGLDPVEQGAPPWEVCLPLEGAVDGWVVQVDSTLQRYRLIGVD